jgi:hypothetical protein
VIRTSSAQGGVPAAESHFGSTTCNVNGTTQRIIADASEDFGRELSAPLNLASPSPSIPTAESTYIQADASARWQALAGTACAVQNLSPVLTTTPAGAESRISTVPAALIISPIKATSSVQMPALPKRTRYELRKRQQTTAEIQREDCTSTQLGGLPSCWSCAFAQGEEPCRFKGFRSFVPGAKTISGASLPAACDSQADCFRFPPIWKGNQAEDDKRAVRVCLTLSPEPLVLTSSPARGCTGSPSDSYTRTGAHAIAWTGCSTT